MEHLMPPLLADIGEVIGALVGLLMLVLWVIGQLAEGKKQMNRPPAPRPAEPQPAPQRPVAAQPAAKPQVGGLRGEMEEFLRRAAAQKGGAQPAAANRAPAMPVKARPSQADKIEVLVDEQGRLSDSRRGADRTRVKEQRPSSAPRPAAAKDVAGSPRRPVAGKRESVADHVQQHVSASARAMAKQSSALGQRIVQDDADFDVQLKAKFDHEVGTLASAVRLTDTPSESPDRRDIASQAGQFATLLATPDGMRQAMIINEILRRPSERW